MGPTRSGKYQFNSESLVELRKTLRLTQSKMADLLGVPANTLSRWEKGWTIPDANSLASVYSVAMEHHAQPNFFQPVVLEPTTEKRCTQCGEPRSYAYSSWCRDCQYKRRKEKLESEPNGATKACTRCGGPRTYAYASWCKDCQAAHKRLKRAKG